LVAVPVALAWLYTGAALGRKQEMLRSPADRSMSTQALSP